MAKNKDIKDAIELLERQISKMQSSGNHTYGEYKQALSLYSDVVVLCKEKLSGGTQEVIEEQTKVFSN